MLKQLIRSSLVILTFLFILTPALASSKADSSNAVALDVGQTEVVTQNSISRDQPVEIARRGCCSHHGGVCGCENGRAKCCDGTLSPTCGCD